MLGRKDFIRYSRQIMLPDFGETGQETLQSAKIAVIGLGGLGSPVVQYLAGAGIGNFVLIDDDSVSLDNLHRQLLYREADIGQPKALVAAMRIGEIYPSARVQPIVARLDGDDLTAQLANVDLVLDCTDTLESRLEVNRAAVKAKIAHIIGTGIRLEGQIISFDHSRSESPCFACLMSENESEGLTCSESGVMGPVLGVVGAMMAMSAIKYLSMPDQFIVNRWQFYDASKQSWMSIEVTRDQQCLC